MSQENIEIVQRLYDGWAREGVRGPLELLDPEIEYVNPPGAIEPGVRHGLAAFIAAVESVFEGWADWHMEPEEFKALGNQVAVVLAYRARARQSGIEMDGRESALLTLRNAKVVRYEWFQEPGDALEALEPPG
jgi:ketosteroid isomerase-like protein